MNENGNISLELISNDVKHRNGRNSGTSDMIVVDRQMDLIIEYEFIAQAQIICRHTENSPFEENLLLEERKCRTCSSTFNVVITTFHEFDVHIVNDTRFIRQMLLSYVFFLLFCVCVCVVKSRTSLNLICRISTDKMTQIFVYLK